MTWSVTDCWHEVLLIQCGSKLYHEFDDSFQTDMIFKKKFSYRDFPLALFD